MCVGVGGVYVLVCGVCFSQERGNITCEKREKANQIAVNDAQVALLAALLASQLASLSASHCCIVYTFDF